MADKKIPDLDPITSIDDTSLFIVDTGTETFRITAANLALFIRESGVLPAGVTNAFAGSVAPAGWLLCDGSAISRTTYVKLFTAIGTAFGIGNGTTTFNVPDLRGRFVAGKDNMGGTPASRLTTAVSGVDGLTLGAAGSTQNFTPAGTIGGSQSIAHVHTIAHTHTMAHTHNFAHAHQAIYRLGSDGSVYTRDVLDSASTTWTTGSGTDTFLGTFSFIVGAASPTRAHIAANSALTGYTGGALAAPAGSGSSATTGSASSSTTSASSATNSGGMSTNTTVNGSNFTFTGTATSRVPPTLVMNYIIKT